MRTTISKNAEKPSIFRNIFTRTSLRNAVTSAIVCLYGINAGQALAAPTLTEFTLNSGAPGVTSGSFSNKFDSIGDADDLRNPVPGSGFTFNFISQVFTPSANGSYTFGVSSSPNDAVLILYQGSFDPLSPQTNALVVDDDSNGQGAGGLTMGTCDGSASLCPKMTESLTASIDYYVVITSYNNGQSVYFPAGFYVYGEPVSVGGLPLFSVLGSSQNRGNSIVFGAASIIDATPELLTLFTAANLSSDQQVSDAVSQTMPLLASSSQMATNNTLSEINRVIQSRIEVKRGLASGDGFQGDKNIWLKPFYSRADQKKRSAVAGYDAETTGMVFGLDVAASQSLNLGVAFAYATSNIDSKSSIARQSMDVDVYQLIGYGSYALDQRSNLSFQLDIGQNHNKGTRNIAFTGTAADANYNSRSAHMGLSIDRIYPLSEQTSFVPRVRADYTWIKDDSYQEKGADALNLKVNDRTTDALMLGLDGTILHSLSQQTQLSLNVGAGYDVLNDTTSITSAYAGAANTSFTTQGIKQSPWIGLAGAGLTHTTLNGTAVTLRYDAEHRSDFFNQTASVQAKWMF